VMPLKVGMRYAVPSGYQPGDVVVFFGLQAMRDEAKRVFLNGQYVPARSIHSAGSGEAFLIQEGVASDS
jgi:hypothetical protein